MLPFQKFINIIAQLFIHLQKFNVHITKFTILFSNQMSIKTRQKSIFPQLEEPKSSARVRCTNQNLSRKKQKLLKKQTSSKCLKLISPKKDQTSFKNISNRFASYMESYQEKDILMNDNCFVEENDDLSTQKTLRTIGIDQYTNLQLMQKNQKSRQNRLNEQKPQKNCKNLLVQKYLSNQTKIKQMRLQLSKIYQTFKERQKQMHQMKTNVKTISKIRSQNQFLSKEISRVKQMIKQALLQREKLKHGPLNNKCSKS